MCGGGGGGGTLVKIDLWCFNALPKQNFWCHCQVVNIKTFLFITFMLGKIICTLLIHIRWCHDIVLSS